MIRLTAILSVALSVCIFLAGSAAADFERNDWKFFKDIPVPQSVESEYAFFQVDAETYDGGSGSLQSLRIIDADMREIPHQIVTKEKSEKREEFPPKFLNNSYRDGEYNSFVLDFGDEGPSVNELTVVTDSKNFTRRASVEGSGNQSEWNMLTDDAYIYDFSRNVRSKHLRIKFPLSNFRYLRVRIYDDSGGPLEITGAQCYRVTTKPAEAESWPMKIIGKHENEKERTTEIVLDAGYRGLPIRRLNLDVTSRNYHRSVRIESSADREKWAVLGSGVIFNYDLPAFKKTGDSVSFRENSGGRYFKVTVKNFDDRPIEIVGASGSSLVRRVVVSLTGKDLYEVYFGNPEAKTPRYDLAHRMRYIDTQELPRLILGPRQSNLNYSGPKSVRPWSEEHAGLLWVVMGAIIVALALLIFNLTRKTPPEKTQE